MALVSWNSFWVTFCGGAVKVHVQLRYSSAPAMTINIRLQADVDEIKICFSDNNKWEKMSFSVLPDSKVSLVVSVNEPKIG